MSREFRGNPVRVRFGPFTLDEDRRQLLRAGVDLHLTPKAFDLLVVLVASAPRVMPKVELHERLWPGTYVSDATLAGLVKELRRALADRDRTAPLIRTAHRVGYAFSAALESLEDTASRQKPSAWLVFADRRVALARGEAVVGRHPECDVRLDAAGVSRRHARIFLDNGTVQLEDLGSKNGTMVGDVRITAPARLEDGDRIAFGAVTAVYRASDGGPTTETAIRPGQSGSGTSRPEPLRPKGGGI